MTHIAIAALILVLVAPSVGFAEFSSSAGHLQLVMGGQRAGGLREGRGKRFGFGKRGQRRFLRGDLTRYFYYRYPRYFYRNYGGIRKFYPRKNRSFYPRQGGSDYRDFYFPKR